MSWDTGAHRRLGLPDGLLPGLVAGRHAGRRADPAGREPTPVSPARCRSPLSARTTPHRRSSESRPIPRTSPTSPAAPGVLVGVELDQPVLTDESRAANFTNERGVDGTIRYLRNVMGLWLLSRHCGPGELQGQSPAGRTDRSRPRPCPPADRSSTRTAGVPGTGRHAGADRPALRDAGRRRRTSPAGPCAASWTAWQPRSQRQSRTRTTLRAARSR